MSARLDERLPDSNARHENGRLLDVGLLELLGGAFKTQLAQVEAEKIIGSIEYGSGRPARLGDVASHPHRLGTLTWENNSRAMQSRSSGEPRP
jgi:hypothetical protein